MTSAKSIAEVIRAASLHNTQLYLSPQTLDEICRHLEGKSKRLSLEEIREWCNTRESLRDPIFIVPTDGPPFWILEEGDVDDFHMYVLTGRYTVWTGRPTENQISRENKRRQA